MRKALPILALALLIGAFVLLRLPSEPSQESLIDTAIAPVNSQEPDRDADLVPVAKRETRDEMEVASPRGPEIFPEVLMEDAAEGAEATVSSSSAPRQPWMLELRVEAPVRAGETPPPAAVQIRARLDGDPFAMGDGIRASCAIGQVTSIDIGSFRGGAQEPAMLSIVATHPTLGCDPMNVELIAEHIAPDELRAPVAATLRLTRALTIGGTVVMGPEGRQGRNSGTARVGVWRSLGSQPVGDSPVVTDWVDVKGEYSLRVPTTGEYFVAAAEASSRADGRVCQVTDALPNVAMEPLVLGAGASINGQFVAGKGPPPERVNYRVSRPLKGPTLRFEELWDDSHTGAFVWTRGGLLRSEASGTSHEDGTFTVGGLETGPHELKMDGLVNGHFRSDPTIWSVQAPASDLLFDIGLSTIAVKFAVDPDQPLPRDMKLFLTRPLGTGPGTEEEEIRCEKGKFWWGDAEAEFLFTPLAPVRFRLAVQGARDVVRDLITPRSGESTELVLDVPVGEAVAAGDLRIRLTGAVPPDGTSFVVHASLLRQNQPRSTFRKTSDGDAHVLQSVQGELRIQDLPAGVTRLAVYPATWVGHRASHHLDTLSDVTILDGREVVVDLELVLGGRLRISKPDGAGGYHSGTCTIHRPGGDPIPVQFIAYAANGGGAWGSDTDLLAKAPSLVMPNLEPGTYEIRFGGDAKVVSVRPGEIVDVIFE
ncbi:MAG: hypothetical protein ACJAQ3_004084 [Planctomycetota bacterium]|jgi:hypothetical protein